jgi:hypothetical protein
MTSSTSTKLVAGFALGGIALALWSGNTGADRYRKVWGVTLTAAVGAALADFAPGLVGWFFGLVIVAYGASHYKAIGDAVSGAKAQATGTAKKG